ncbi:MAG: cytidylate kinase [Dehalococcoidia bacterium]|nr:cytidylate kinase [Dehalococcoidia bacterium]
MPKPSIIAIDGPVAAGKTAVGTLLARHLGYRFVDTGSMYRAITWAALRDKVGPEDEAGLTALAQRVQIEVTPSNGQKGPRLKIDGKDVTEELRTREVERGVALISRFAQVRQAMVARQRTLAQPGRIVMAGRDIGTVVLPDAPLKIFLTASPNERARRRQRDMEELGQSLQLSQVLSDLLQRDKLDTERANSPLRPGDDAHIIDTDHIDLTQVVERILALTKDN